MPKPTTAPPNECLLLCLPLCLHCQPTGILSFTPSPVCFFITFQPASERTHHRAHYSRAICSRFGMDSGPVFPHLQIRQPGPPWLLPAGAGFPRETFTRRLWSNHLLSSASKVKKLETSEALKNTFNLERQPHFFSSTSCLTLTRAEEILLRRGRAYFLLSFFPGKRLHWICTASCFYCWNGPNFLSLPPLAPSLSHGSAHAGCSHSCREAKVKYDMNLSTLHLQRTP